MLGRTCARKARSRAAPSRTAARSTSPPPTGRSPINGRTCAKLWSYQYDPTDIAAGANNKGVAIGGGRVIRGTTDGHLIALDIKTGDVLWNRKIMDSSTGASAMAAPLIWHDLVFMGAAGGDVGVSGRSSRPIA